MSQAMVSGETRNGSENGGIARDARAVAGVCPYCGEERRAGTAACGSCGGLFEPLSKQATQNSMGPWLVRDEKNPFLPGRSYAAVRALAMSGRIGAETAVRGPTTGQFWMRAGETPGIAHLLGRCHACRERAASSDRLCGQCGVSFVAPMDRQHLGLGAVRPVHGPREAPPAPSSAPPGSPPVAASVGGASAASAVSLGAGAGQRETYSVAGSVNPTGDRSAAAAGDAAWGVFGSSEVFGRAEPSAGAGAGPVGVMKDARGGPGRLGLALIGVAAAATLGAMTLWVVRGGDSAGRGEPGVAASPAPGPAAGSATGTSRPGAP